MEILSVELIYDLHDLQNLYYENGKTDFFARLKVKRSLSKLLILIITFLVFYFLSFKYPEISWILFASAIFICVVLIILSIQFYNYTSWKKPVDAFIAHLTNLKKSTLILTDEAFEFITDDITTLEKWHNIKNAQITKNYCTVFNKENAPYIFFASSMSAHEFEKVSMIISEKVRN